MIVLREIVEVLDRRIPDIERAGESVVMREAKRLRACAVQRVAALHRPAR